MLDHPRNVETSFAGSGVLVGHCLVRLVLDKGVSTDGDYRDSRHDHVLLCTSIAELVLGEPSDSALLARGREDIIVPQVE
jgi:hypothetical protein